MTARDIICAMVIVLTTAAALAAFMVPIFLAIHWGFVASPWMIAFASWSVFQCGTVAVAGVALVENIRKT